jgi:hypothetical protein
MVKKLQMKKGQERLKLHRETLRQLESPELMRIAGGISIVDSCNTGCNTTYFGCCQKY